MCEVPNPVQKWNKSDNFGSESSSFFKMIIAILPKNALFPQNGFVFDHLYMIIIKIYWEKIHFGSGVHFLGEGPKGHIWENPKSLNR